MARQDSALGLSEDLIRSQSGGVFTNENKADVDYIMFILDQFRALAIESFYNDPRKRLTELHNSLLQRYTVSKVDAEQISEPTDNCIKVIRFKMPQVLMVNNVVNGIGYIGSPNGRNGFRVLRNRGELTGVYEHNFLSPEKGNRIYALIDVDDYVEIHGNDGQDNLLINACFSSPTLVPNFDIENDRYPINNAIVGKMKDYINKITLNQIYQTPEDRIQDFQHQLSKLKLQIQPK